MPQHLPVARDAASTGQAPILHDTLATALQHHAFAPLCSRCFRRRTTVLPIKPRVFPSFSTFSLLTPNLALQLHSKYCVSRSVRLETGQRVKGSPVSGWIKGFRVDPGFRKGRLAHLLAWVVNVSRVGDANKRQDEDPGAKGKRVASGSLVCFSATPTRPPSPPPPASRTRAPLRLHPRVAYATSDCKFTRSTPSPTPVLHPRVAYATSGCKFTRFPGFKLETEILKLPPP